MQLSRQPFYYIRHGQTDWNAGKLCVGQVDVPLNGNGIKQAESAASLVHTLSLSAIFHSPLARAHLTASILRGETNLPIISDIGLQEVCLGIKEGQSENDPSDDFVLAWLAGEQIEGAETFGMFRDRVLAAINRCLSLTEGPPLIVAHSGVFMATASACGFIIDEIEHCRPYYFEPVGVGWMLHDMAA